MYLKRPKMPGKVSLKININIINHFFYSPAGTPPPLLLIHFLWIKCPFILMDPSLIMFQLFPVFCVCPTN